MTDFLRCVNRASIASRTSQMNPYRPRASAPALSAADRSGVSTKALLPIAGQPMLAHVLRALRASPLVGPITILAQNSAELAAEPELAGFADLHFADSGQGISNSLAAALPPGDDPLLVTTADNVLLTPTMIAEFLGGAEDSDVAVAMVERDVRSRAIRNRSGRG